MIEEIGNEKVIDFYELYPRNGRKSFYGKATVYETKNYTYLKSYETLMCRYVKATGEIQRLSSARSMTTSSHLGSFHRAMGVCWNIKRFYNQDIVQLESEEIDDEFMKKFEEDYNGLHPEIKERLANSGVMVHTKKQAEDVMSISKAFSALFALTESK